MNAAQAHDACTRWIAQTLNLSVDQSIFIGPPPPGLGNFAAVECISGSSSGCSSLNRLQVTLTLRRHTQSEAETLLASLESALPRFGVSGFCAIELAGETKRSVDPAGYQLVRPLQLLYT